MNRDSSRLSEDSRALAEIQQQLIISLKFHHRRSLEKLPLEMALKSMMEAWSSCQSNSP